MGYHGMQATPSTSPRCLPRGQLVLTRGRQHSACWRTHAARRSSRRLHACCWLHLASTLRPLPTRRYPVGPVHPPWPQHDSLSRFLLCTCVVHFADFWRGGKSVRGRLDAVLYPARCQPSRVDLSPMRGACRAQGRALCTPCINNSACVSLLPPCTCSPTVIVSLAASPQLAPVILDQLHTAACNGGPAPVLLLAAVLDKVLESHANTHTLLCQADRLAVWVAHLKQQTMSVAHHITYVQGDHACVLGLCARTAGPP